MLRIGESQMEAMNAVAEEGFARRLRAFLADHGTLPPAWDIHTEIREARERGLRLERHIALCAYLRSRPVESEGAEEPDGDRIPRREKKEDAAAFTIRFERFALAHAHLFDRPPA